MYAVRSIRAPPRRSVCRAIYERPAAVKFSFRQLSHFLAAAETGSIKSRT